MKGAGYRAALDAACREYEDLLARRTAVEVRIDQLHDTIAALGRLCGLTPTVPWGLTDGCRAVLRRAQDPLSAPEVRDRLRHLGFDVSRYSNELSALHTTLNRMAEAGEAKRVTRPSGERAYVLVRVRAMTREQALAYPLFGDEPPRIPRRRS